MKITLCLFALLIGFTYPAYSLNAMDTECGDRGFLEKPPIYIGSFPDFPLAAFSMEIPCSGVTVPDVDYATLESDGWRQNGHNVQPALNAQTRALRVGAMHGFNNNWAAGIAIPLQSTRVQGNTGGLPSHGVGQGLGDILLYAKKRVTSDDSGGHLVVSAGLELPTGKDDATFDQPNAVTNGYFSGPTPRMPLGWQAGAGTFNGYLAVAYGKRMYRVSYAALLAGKLYGVGDQDTKLGNILVGTVSGTYGVTRNVALSLGLTARYQADDSYPNSPLPVEGFLLAGTTTHGTTVYIAPSVRVKVFNRLTIGMGVNLPVIKPDNGMVPRMNISFIAYPSL